MEIEIVSTLSAHSKTAWESLLSESELFPDSTPQKTVLIWENNELIATGSRDKNILKFIAVSAAHQGEDLTASLITNLRQEAFSAGYKHLFLYTKPKNMLMFSSLFFYPIAKTKNVLLMENKNNGIKGFLADFPDGTEENTGAVVMNCNPFTLGHRHLIETASKQCDKVYVFVLSEESEPFLAVDRLNLVKKGTKDLKNVTVLPTGPYLISSATFPTYFLKERDKANFVQCELDVQIFAKYYAPKFNIKKRYVAKEPFSAMTEKYNECLAEYLPQYGIELIEIPRLECEGTAISATKVRSLLHKGKPEEIKKLVPKTTFCFLEENGFI